MVCAGMRGQVLRALRRLVAEPELAALSESLLAQGLATGPSAAALARNGEALQRWAPRLFSTLAAARRAGGSQALGAALPARLQQCERLQVGERPLPVQEGAWLCLAGVGGAALQPSPG